MKQHSNKSVFFRCLAYFMRHGKRLSAHGNAPAFLFAATTLGFGIAPAQAEETVVELTDGAYADETVSGDQLSLKKAAEGTGKIELTGTSSVGVEKTVIYSEVELTISSSSKTLEFGAVEFNIPSASSAIVINTDGVKFDSVNSNTNSFGEVSVESGSLTVVGDAYLQSISVSGGGTVEIAGTSTIDNVFANAGGTLKISGGTKNLHMQGGTLEVGDFELESFGTDATGTVATGTVKASGKFGIGEGVSLTAKELNLETAGSGAIEIKEGAHIDLGAGTVTLADNTSLTIGVGNENEKTESLTAKELVAGTGATTTLNGGELTLTGDGIDQSLDSLAASSTGTVSVSGENATAKFSANKTFAAALNLKSENGTLKIGDGAAVSTAGTVETKNLTIGSGNASVKASAFSFGENGTLAMSGGTLDLTATDGANTNIYGIADGSSGKIDEGNTAGTITLNKSFDAGQLNFNADSGTVTLADQGESEAIAATTTGNVFAQNLNVGKNALSAAYIGSSASAGTKLNLDGGEITATGASSGSSVRINGFDGNAANGKISATGDVARIELDGIGGALATTGKLDLSGKTVWVSGNGLTLGENSVVSATGTNAGSNNPTGLVVGGNGGTTATTADFSAQGIMLENVGAITVHQYDKLKLSGDQTIGVGDNGGKIYLSSDASSAANKIGTIETSGSLTALGETDLTKGGVIKFVENENETSENAGTITLGKVSGQGQISGKNIALGSISDVNGNGQKVVLAGTFVDGNAPTSTAAESLTFTGIGGTKTTAIGNNAGSVVDTNALVLNSGAENADAGISVGIGTDTNKTVLVEENLNKIEIGAFDKLETNTADALDQLHSVKLGNAASWTHKSSGVSVSAQEGASEDVPVLELGNSAQLSVKNGSFSATGKVSAGDEVSLKATGEISLNGAASFGKKSEIEAGGNITAAGTVSLGAETSAKSTSGNIDFSGAKATLGYKTTLETEASSGAGNGDIELGEIESLIDGQLVIANIDSARDIVFTKSTQASLSLEGANDIILEDGVNLQLFYGRIDDKDTLQHLKIGENATLELLENNSELSGGDSGTPRVIAYNLSAVELADAGTLKVGGTVSLGDEAQEIYATNAKADTVKNADGSSVGTVEVFGTNAKTGKVSTLEVSGAFGDTQNGGVNVKLNEGGVLKITGTQDAYVAQIGGNGGKLIAQEASGTKHDIVITASNELGNNIEFTADTLKISDLNVNDGNGVEVKLSAANLSAVENIVVADAGTSDPAASHSTLVLEKTTVTGDGKLGSISVGEAADKNGTLKIVDGSEIETEKLSVIGGASVLSIDNSTLKADGIADAASSALAGTLELKTGGALIVTDDDLTLANIAAGSDGTIETLKADSTISFAEGVAADGETLSRLTINAGTQTADDESVSYTGTVDFAKTSLLADGSEINAKKISVSQAGAEVDLANAAINAQDIEVSAGTLKTQENFVKDLALKNVAISGDGTFGNDGDITVSESLKLGQNANTEKAGTLVATGDITIDAAITSNDAAGTQTARGTISGKNVSIDLSAQTQNFANTLKINALGESGNGDGTIALDGSTANFADGEFSADALLNKDTTHAGKLAVGSDAESEATKIKVTDAAESLDGIGEITIGADDELHVVNDWERQSDLSVNNAGTLKVDGALTVAAEKTFAVAGGTANFAGGISNNGNLQLVGGVSATAKNWSDAESATLTLAGTEENRASLTIAEAQANSSTTIAGEISANTADLTVEKGSLVIAGGNGEISDLSIATREAGAGIEFSQKDFASDGAVSIATTKDGNANDSVKFTANVSLGAGSSVTTTTLDVGANSDSEIAGTISVENLKLGTTDGAAASLELSGDHNSVFANLTDAAGTTLKISGAQKLSQSENYTAIDGYSVKINGALEIAGVIENGAGTSSVFTPQANMLVAGTGTVSLSDYGKLDVSDNKLELAENAKLSLESGAQVVAGTLDLSEAKTGAVKVAGSGEDGDSAQIAAGTLAIGNDAGTVELSSGGKLSVEKLAEGDFVKLTQKNGSGNIWIDAASQFELKNGDITVTESTRGEIIASGEKANVIFGNDDPATNVYTLSGITTYDLSLGTKQELNITVSEYNDKTTGAFTYSQINVKNKLDLNDAKLTVSDIARSADADDFSMGTLGQATLRGSVLEISGAEQTGGNSSEITIAGINLDASTLKLENVAVNAAATNSGKNSITVGGNSSVALNDVALGADISANAGTVAVSGEVEIGSGNSIAMSSNTTLELGGNISGDGSVKLDGAKIVVAESKKTIANLEVDSGSIVASNANSELSVSNLTAAGTLAVDKNTALAVDNLSLDGGKIEARGSVELGKVAANTEASVSAKDLNLAGTVSENYNALAFTAEKITVSADNELSSSAIDAGAIEVVANLKLKENATLDADATTVAENGALTIDGVNADLGDVEVSGTLEIKADANVAGTTTLASNGSLSVENATVNGNIAFADNAERATVKITAATVNGEVSLSGESNKLMVYNSVIESLVTTGGTLVLDDKNTFGSIAVSENTLVKQGGMVSAETISVGLKGYTVTEGATLNIGDKLVADGGAFTVENDATVNGAVVVKNSAEDHASTVAGTLDGKLTLDAGDVEISGKVSGTTTASNGSKLVSSGTLDDVTLEDSSFTQNGGSAQNVSLADSSLTQAAAGTISSLTLENSTANLAGTVDGKLTLNDGGNVVAQADQTFESVALNGGKISGNGNDVAISFALENAQGEISGAKNVSLNGLSDGANGVEISANEKLTLAGTTTLGAENSLLAAETIVVAGTLDANASALRGNVEIANEAEANLAVSADVSNLKKVDGTANLSAGENAFALTNLGGAGTVNKSGNGLLSLRGNAGFTGTLNAHGGDVALGDVFGGNINVDSAATFAGANNAVVAGTLTLASGSKIEIGDRSGAAKLTLEKLAIAEVRTRASGTIEIVHDFYADGTVDQLALTGTDTDLSNAVAHIRGNDVDLSKIGADGKVIDLVLGDVVNGYGSLSSDLDLANIRLTNDGKSLALSLNWQSALAAQGAPLFNANQRAIAAALKAGNATGTLADLLGENGLGATQSTDETARALDSIGALHTVSMMPAQIDGTWNLHKNLRGAIGTGAFMNYQFGRPQMPFGAWVQFVSSENDVSSTEDRIGWDRSMVGAMAGFEYAVSENLLAGVALGFENADVKARGNKVEDSSFHVDFYAKHRSGNFEQRGILSLGMHSYDIDRTIAAGTQAYSLSDSTDGYTVALSYDAAYNFRMKEWLTLAPIAQISLALNTIDGWDESGAGTASLRYDDQSALTALAGVGGKASFEIPNFSYPAEAIRLDVYTMFTAEFGDRSSDVDATFSSTGSSFTMAYDDPNPCAVQLGANFTAPLTNRVALFGGISTEIRDDESGFNANLGVRVGW